MPVQEYKCPSGHTTTKVISIAKSPGPKSIRCPKQTTKNAFPEDFIVRSPKVIVTCGRQAKRVEVYHVAVGGDLPTRGAF